MQGGKQPRPPVVSKKHPPCKDCTHLPVEQFLEHLQQLPWYNGQVRALAAMQGSSLLHSWLTAPKR